MPAVRLPDAFCIPAPFASGLERAHAAGISWGSAGAQLRGDPLPERVNPGCAGRARRAHTVLHFQTRTHGQAPNTSHSSAHAPWGCECSAAKPPMPSQPTNKRVPPSLQLPQLSRCLLPQAQQAPRVLLNPNLHFWATFPLPIPLVLH